MRSHPRVAERFLGGSGIERPAHGFRLGDVEALAFGPIDAAGVEFGLGVLHALLECLHLGVELAEDIGEFWDRMIVELAFDGRAVCFSMEVLPRWAQLRQAWERRSPRLRGLCRRDIFNIVSRYGEVNIKNIR